MNVTMLSELNGNGTHEEYPQVSSKIRNKHFVPHESGMTVQDYSPPYTPYNHNQYLQQRNQNTRDMYSGGPPHGPHPYHSNMRYPHEPYPDHVSLSSFHEMYKPPPHNLHNLQEKEPSDKIIIRYISILIGLAFIIIFILAYFVYKICNVINTLFK